MCLEKERTNHLAGGDLDQFCYPQIHLGPLYKDPTIQNQEQATKTVLLLETSHWLHFYPEIIITNYLSDFQFPTMRIHWRAPSCKWATQPTGILIREMHSTKAQISNKVEERKGALFRIQVFKSHLCYKYCTSIEVFSDLGLGMVAHTCNLLLAIMPPCF